MQPISSRRRAATTAPAAPVAGVAPALAELRFIMANGLLVIQHPEFAAELLKNEQSARLAAEAEQAQLSKVYTVAQLAERLGISVRSVGDLLREGRIRYARCGGKAYRVSELACREFLGDVPATH